MMPLEVLTYPPKAVPNGCVCHYTGIVAHTAKTQCACIEAHSSADDELDSLTVCLGRHDR